jgi:hypothetical protein
LILYRRKTVPIPKEIVSALIGACSALTVMLIKDLVIAYFQDRRENKLTLTQERLEKAYVPLYSLIYYLTVSTQEIAEKSKTEIVELLKRHGHLLSPQTLSGLHILVEGIDENDTETIRRFDQEYAALRDAFYRLHYDKAAIA